MIDFDLREDLCCNRGLTVLVVIGGRFDKEKRRISSWVRQFAGFYAAPNVYHDPCRLLWQRSFQPYVGVSEVSALKWQLYR
jgi:hypothetical protein